MSSQELQLSIEKLEQRIGSSEERIAALISSHKNEICHLVEQLRSNVTQLTSEIKTTSAESLKIAQDLGNRITIQIEELKLGQVIKREFGDALKLSEQNTEKIMRMLEQVNSILEVLARQTTEMESHIQRVAPSRPSKYDALQGAEDAKERDLRDIMRAISLLKRY